MEGERPVCEVVAILITRVFDKIAVKSWGLITGVFDKIAIKLWGLNSPLTHRNSMSIITYRR